MKTVAIVGGGITGLTAAFKLCQARIPCTLYEAGERVGGPIKTTIENGYLSENGPNTILETSPFITALINDLGLQDRRLDANPVMNKNYIVRGGKLRQLPLSPPAFARSSLFSVSAKVRIGLEPFLRQKSESEDEALSDFVLRHFGQEFLDYAINPFVAGVYAGRPENLSTRYGFPKLQAVEDKYGSILLGAVLGARERKKRAEVAKSKANKLSFDSGLQVLVDALYYQIRQSVYLRSKVTSLRRTTEGWSVTSNQNGQEVQENHAAVILTAPAHRLAQIELQTEEQTNFKQLGDIIHPPVARVVMGFRRNDVAHPLNGFGFLFPERERLKILGTTFSSSIFPHRAPLGHVVLTTYVGGCRQPDLATEAPEKLFDIILRDLQRVLGVRARPTYLNHVLFQQAIPQYNVGYKKFADFMDTLESRNPGLHFAGSYRNGISVANCIVAGHQVAERIAKTFPTSNFQPLLTSSTV